MKFLLVTYYKLTCVLMYARNKSGYTRLLLSLLHFGRDKVIPINDKS